MHNIKEIAQYELYSSQGVIPLWLSPWLQGIYRRYVLSSGLHVLFADIKTQQEFDLVESAVPGVYFTFVTKQNFDSDSDLAENTGIGRAHSDDSSTNNNAQHKCHECRSQSSQLTQATVLEQALKGTTRLLSNQRMTCLQIFMPFSLLARRLGVDAETIGSLWTGQEGGAGRLSCKSFQIHIDVQIAYAIKAIRRLGLKGDPLDAELLLSHQCESLLQRLLSQLNEQNRDTESRSERVGGSSFPQQSYAQPPILH